MKSILLLLSALLLGQLAGCSKEPPKPAAQDVALGYYQKFISEQYAEAYEYLSEADKKILAVEEFTSFIAPSMAESTLTPDLMRIRKVLMQDVKIYLADEATTPGTDNSKEALSIDGPVMVVLQAEVPDYTSVFAELFKMALQSAFDENTPEVDPMKMILELTKGKEFPLKKLDPETLTMVSENGSWKVFLNLQKMKSDRETEARAKKEKEAREAKEKEDALVDVSVKKDEFTDEVLSVDFDLRQEREMFSITSEKAISLAVYEDNTYTVILHGTNYSFHDESVEVKYRFDKQEALSNPYRRQKDMVFTREMWKFYEVLDGLRNTKQLLVKVGDESSITYKYYRINQRINEYLCLVDKHIESFEQPEYFNPSDCPTGN